MCPAWACPGQSPPFSLLVSPSPCLSWLLACHRTADELGRLLDLVGQEHPKGAKDWEDIASRLGRWSYLGNTVRTKYKITTSQDYSKEGVPPPLPGEKRRVDKFNRYRSMARVAFTSLPLHTGNFNDAVAAVLAEPAFAADLDWGIQSGTRAKPRWRHNLKLVLQNYPEFLRTGDYKEGQIVYRLDTERMLSADQGAAEGKGRGKRKRGTDTPGHMGKHEHTRGVPAADPAAG